MSSNPVTPQCPEAASPSTPAMPTNEESKVVVPVPPDALVVESVVTKDTSLLAQNEPQTAKVVPPVLSVAPLPLKVDSTEALPNVGLSPTHPSTPVSVPSTPPSPLADKTNETLPSTPVSVPSAPPSPLADKATVIPQPSPAAEPTTSPMKQDVDPVHSTVAPATQPVLGASAADSSLAADEEAIPDTANLYIFGDPKSDRTRIIAQCYLFKEFIRRNARLLITGYPKRILDVGCGEGQLTLQLSELYPQAQIIGIDLDAPAIEAAKKSQSSLPNRSGNTEFVVGDIRDKLPEGPFDLIYISMVMLHLTHPKELIDKLLLALTPGGQVWIKDLHPDWIRSYNHPSWWKLGDLLFDTMDKIERNVRVSLELEKLLTDVGFVNVKVVKERYEMTNETLRGRFALSIALGVYMNTRKVVSKIQGIPEEELLRLNKDLLQITNKITGNYTFLNVIGSRPNA